MHIQMAHTDSLRKNPQNTFIPIYQYKILTALKAWLYISERTRTVVRKDLKIYS